MEKATTKLLDNAGECSPCLNSVECSLSIVLPKSKRLAKSKEAIKLLGISRGTLRRWELAGMIQPVRFNSKLLLWPISDIEKLIEAYSVGTERRAA
jgi:predicted DNA-binding transcriptional regulator AlpA